MSNATKSAQNPYAIGNPVTGSLFVGREDLLRQLEELWMTRNQLQSVVLSGNRRMGKTSLLKNLANLLGSQIKVIYVNLQRLGAVSQGVAEVLMTISDEIATAFNISPPDDNDFLQFPQRTFERYLKQVVANMPDRGLIIALDEFETIEELIKKKQISPAFMGFLRGLVQMNPEKIAFAFAGFHTLEEMTADYFEPFLKSVIPIRVSFLDCDATRQILLKSAQSEGFNYTGEALDLIYSLTSGQPYLVQLIGFQLVRNYNERLFEQGRDRDNTFTGEDIEAVINQQFFQQGRYYFEGVLVQATKGVTGQQEIIKALAPHPQGLSRENLASTTNKNSETFAAAIETLKRHDVIAKKDANYYISVELFRQWVVKNKLEQYYD